MAKERNPNPMKEAHMQRLRTNWHVVKENLDLDDIIYTLEDKGVLDTPDVELIEKYSTKKGEKYSSKKGFKYLFTVLTEYGGANGLYVFVDALKSKDEKYATIIAELQDVFDEPNDDLDEKDEKIFKLERHLEVERDKVKELEKKLKKMKTESAAKDKKIYRLKTELKDVQKRVMHLESTIEDMRTGKNQEMNDLLQNMIQCQLQLHIKAEIRTPSHGPPPGTDQMNKQRKTSAPNKPNERVLSHLQSPRK